MKITTETLPERQVKLQIEVDADQHSEALEAAYKRLAPRVQIPGFRPGKAPRPLIEKQLGRHRLLDEAMDILIPKVYREAIEQEELTPVASPALELVSHEPLVFTVTVPLHPLVDLGDHKSLRLSREPATVTDEQVEESMRALRKRYGTLEPVDRPIQKGNVIRGHLKAELGGGVIFDQEDVEYRVSDEGLSSLPGLIDALVGLKKGADFNVTSEVPADFSDSRIAGRTVTYQGAVQEVKEEKLADEDEAFAKQVGEGFESVKALRDRVREDLQKAAEAEALSEYEKQAVDALLKQAKLDYAAVMLDHEIEHVIEDQANLDPQDQRAQELYLERLGKSEAEVKESVRPEAEQRLRRSLVLSQFAEAEDITVDDADVDEELQRLTLSSGEQGLQLLRALDTENGRSALRRSLLTRKTLDRLVAIASQEPVAASAAAPEAKRPARTRRSAPRKVEE